MFRSLFACLLAMLSALCAAPASAQSFPARPITIIVPFAAGGLTDQLARALGAKISASVGQPVVIENRPGAGGQIAVGALKQAPADGYTIFIGDIGTLALNPSLFSKLSYDPAKDFQPLARLVIAPSMLVVPKASPYGSVGELIAAAKTKPEGLSCASQGPGSGGHLFCELVRSQTGAKVTHVPYKGSAPALTDVIGGQVDMLFDAIPTSGAFVKEGKVKGLAIGTAKRIAPFPDVPTLDELGFAKINEVGWFGAVARSGTPEPIVTKLNAELVAAMQSPEVSKRFADQGLEISTSDARTFTEFMASESAKWGKVIRDAGISLD
jgi:tripartite-type tricarboxylate transporter receptor subunit TctC